LGSVSQKPVTLLLHDGELADVRQLLDELGISFVECIGDPTDTLKRNQWNIVIANPKRISGLRTALDGQKRTRIAIVDNDSRTLRAMLRRHGIDFIVARPVHEAALRLLVLHSLYQGPEKRRQARVSVGTKVQCHSGLLSHFDAILVDLSLQGCRVLCSQPLKRGKRISISLPGSSAGEKAFTVKAEVLRASDAGSEGHPEWTVGMRFQKVSPKVGQLIRKTMELYSQGPARLEGVGPSPGKPSLSTDSASASSDRVSPPLDSADTSSDSASPSPNRAAPSLDAASSSPNSAGLSSDDPSPASSVRSRGERRAGHSSGPRSSAHSERRAGPRKEFAKRVVALDDQASKVLLCRDISLGGMRVEPNDSLIPGDVLLIGIHVRARTEPLVVTARVERDDGKQGLVLAFRNLDAPTEAYLRKMIDFLPIFAARNEEEPGSGLIVSEILERKAS
jgi:hypothetical protein